MRIEWNVNSYIESCERFDKWILIEIDLILNLIYLIHFVIRVCLLNRNNWSIWKNWNSWLEVKIGYGFGLKCIH